jgi:cytochrome c oxidase cbb3-type subunit III
MSPEQMQQMLQQMQQQLQQLQQQQAQPAPQSQSVDTVPADPLTGHAYDGIQEFDNPTPGWWNWLFIGTIAFSVVYFTIVTLAGGELGPIGQYERALKADMNRGGVLKADAKTLLLLSKDADALKAGAAIFAANCVTCHGRSGEGITAPNMTDDSYVNVSKLADIPEVVTQGRNNGAMPAWGNRLRPNEVVQVSAYVASLRGQNKKGKAIEPNARVIPPWSE